jgi:hypothetical protein
MSNGQKTVELVPDPEVRPKAKARLEEELPRLFALSGLWANRNTPESEHLSPLLGASRPARFAGQPRHRKSFCGRTLVASSPRRPAGTE